MTVSALVAVGDSPQGGALVSRLRHPASGVRIVASCEDVTELLVTAATGVAEVALVSSALARFDRDALARLRACGVGVLGLVPPGDEQAERRLRQLGLTHVQPEDAGALAVAAALRAATGQRQSAWGFANPFAALPVPTAVPEGAAPAQGRGRVVAVWGPTGAPGRSTVAAGVAAELALRGWPTLLVDADVYGGTLAPALGLSDETAGFARACRSANAGVLETAALEALVQQVTPTLGALTGVSRADRWPELRPAAVEVVLSVARRLAAVTVVDCAFSLEQDEELSYDTLAPRRNGATLAALDEADVVLVVGSADRVGLDRLVHGLAELHEALPEARTAVVVNRLRPSGLSAQEVRGQLLRFAGTEVRALLPHDLQAVDAALQHGRTLAEAAPTSPLRSALQDLVTALVGDQSPTG